jgi:putative ABC transport system ATP-binding protein
VQSRPLLAYDGVGVSAGAAVILRGIDLEVPGRGITVLVGPSGAGKTTLLRLANRLDVPTAGRVLIDGADAAALDPLALRRRLGMVFQRPVLFAGTVLDNLRVADPAITREAALALLERCALAGDLLDREAATLSGGEGQRACIGRALAADPQALLADEPTASLDPAAREEIEELARALAADGIPVLWVTHDLDQMHRLADTLVVLIDGAVAYQGTVADVGAAPAPVGAFLEGAAGAG